MSPRRGPAAANAARRAPLCDVLTRPLVRADLLVLGGGQGISRPTLMTIRIVCRRWHSLEPHCGRSAWCRSSHPEFGGGADGELLIASGRVQRGLHDRQQLERLSANRRLVASDVWGDELDGGEVGAVPVEVAREQRQVVDRGMRSDVEVG